MSQRFPARSRIRPDASRQRIYFVVLLLICWMLLIGARLLYLQTWQYEWLSARAHKQQEQTIMTAPQRGLILDRQGRELARSIETDSFFAVPGEIKDARATAARLAAALDLDAATLGARLQEAQGRNRKFVWLAREVDAEHAANVEALKLDGVHATKEAKRFYPNGKLAAHVIGFVGLDDAGLAGVERFQNASLNGGAGQVFLDGDGRHHAYDSLEVEPRDGRTVVLTIDQNIQYQTEQLLGDAVERAHAKAGTALVLDPHTGEVLALANAPAFDPNDAHKVSPEARLNGALQNIYEPGSTFKLVTYSAALEEKLARPTDHIDCQMGSITVAGRLVRDGHAYGTLSITEALAKSSNVAAIKLGLRVGDKRMYDYITRFGFGAKTGIELAGETRGLVRPVERWQPSSMGSVAIGQEVGVTPIQMAAAFGAIANDGVRLAPHIIKEVLDADGAVFQRPTPEARRVVSVETARLLHPMLESVTLNGTARRAQLDGYTAAGKTGTAQKIDPRTKSYSQTKYVASFVGFAPVENPSVVIVVVVDEPAGAHHGGEVAAPVFHDIAERVLPYLDVAPNPDLLQPPVGIHDDVIAQSAPAASTDGGRASIATEPEAAATPDAMLPEVATMRRSANEIDEVVYASATERALLMPDVRGRSVRDAARICAQLGLDLEARGEGRALRQKPEPGAKVESGQAVRVDFGRGD